MDIQHLDLHRNELHLGPLLWIMATTPIFSANSPHMIVSSLAVKT